MFKATPKNSTSLNEGNKTLERNGALSEINNKLSHNM